MNNIKKKAIISSAVLAIVYSIMSYFLMFYASGNFATLICFPYIIAFLFGFGLGSPYGYFIVGLTFLSIWYILYKLMFYFISNKSKELL
jgi:hypothetical protein